MCCVILPRQSFGDQGFAEVCRLMQTVFVSAKERAFVYIRNPARSFLKITTSWRTLCEEYATWKEECRLINKRIEEWRPNQPETEQFKACWQRCFVSLEHPETDQLDLVIANGFRLAAIAQMVLEEKHCFPEAGAAPAAVAEVPSEQAAETLRAASPSADTLAA